MLRYFEFQDSKSYKFWQIELEQSTCTVKYGKIGTAGQEKVSTFESAEQAQKEVAKMVAEKVKKGYVEKAAASEKKNAKRVGLSYEEGEAGKTLHDKLAAFLATPQAATTTALVLGAWSEPHSDSPQATLDLLCARAASLPALTELFVGDIDAEECEISWIIQGDYSQVFAAFPNLERLHIKGANSLILCTGALRHDKLKALTIECGGLPKRIIDTISQAQLPALETLNLYLGVEDYGYDASVDDLRPFMDQARWPKLRYLGLADSEEADAIAVAIAEASILDQLETLDLSKGTLSDEGGRALLASSKIGQLQRLDLHYHYLSDEMVKAFKALSIVVDVSEQQQAEDDDWRYPAVTE